MREKGRMEERQEGIRELGREAERSGERLMLMNELGREAKVEREEAQTKKVRFSV